MRDAGDFVGRVVDIRNTAKGVGDRDQLISDPIAVAIRVGQGCCVPVGIDDAGQQPKGREVRDCTDFGGNGERSVPVFAGEVLRVVDS